jgi:hypothetical protein
MKEKKSGEKWRDNGVKEILEENDTYCRTENVGKTRR